MITIAHLTAPAQFGGLERVVAGLCRETVARGHRVVLIATLSPGAPLPAWAEVLRDAGVAVEPLHLSSREYLAERRVVRELLRRHGAQVVHTHGYRQDALHAGLTKMSTSWSRDGVLKSVPNTRVFTPSYVAPFNTG